MVTVKIRKKYGNATVRASITAPSIARALQIAGLEAFFTRDAAEEPVEEVAQRVA